MAGQQGQMGVGALVLSCLAHEQLGQLIEMAGAAS